MCIIVQASDKGLLSESRLRAYEDYHGDGVGVMFLDGNRKPVAEKSKESGHWQKLMKIVPAATPFAIHFRQATAGGVTDDNAHPFVVRDGLLMHNGHINGYGQGGMSDTAEFAQTLDMHAQDEDAVWDALELFAKGNRFCRLTPDRGFARFGGWAKTEVSEAGLIAFSSDPDPQAYRFSSVLAKGNDAWRGMDDCWEGDWKAYQRTYGKQDDDDTLLSVAPWEEYGMTPLEWCERFPEEAADVVESLWYGEEV